MSVVVNQFTHAVMPGGTPLATYDITNQLVTLWPAGVGQGTSIAMKLPEWHMLRASADATVKTTLDMATRRALG